MPAESPNTALYCPHCGKKVYLVDGKLLEEAAVETSREAGGASVWDRKPAASPPRATWGKAESPRAEPKAAERVDALASWGLRRDLEKPAEKDEVPAGWGIKREAEKPEKVEKERAPLGWATRAEAERPAAKVPTGEVLVQERKPVVEKKPVAEKRPVEKPAAEKKPVEKPAAEKKPVEKPAPKPKASKPAAAGAGGGFSVLDVLDTDPTLNAGQRETIRMIYQRFAPDAKKRADVSGAANLTVDDVLDNDPHINRGQAETVRMVYARFAPKK